MKLYIHPAACSLSPHIICRELDLPVEIVEVDRKTHTAGGRDFLAISGNGYVPALELEDGRTLTEGPAVVQFLADLSPEGGMLPATGSFERSRVQSFLSFVTSELHKPMAMMLNPAYAVAKPILAELVAKRLAWVETQLDPGPFLMGQRFTVADPYLFVCVNWSPWIGIDLAPWPALRAFMGRMAERPKVRAAMAAEDLAAHGPDGLFYAPRAMLARAG